MERRMRDLEDERRQREDGLRLEQMEMEEEMAEEELEAMRQATRQRVRWVAEHWEAINQREPKSGNERLREEASGSEAGQFQAVEERIGRLTKRIEDLEKARSRREGWLSSSDGERQK